MIQKIYFAAKLSQATNAPIKDKIGDNTDRNKTTEVHKYIPDELIGQFTTSNKNSSKSYFEQYCKPRAAGHLQIERRFIYALIFYKLLVPKMIRIITTNL